YLSKIFSVQPCIVLALICIVLALIKWLRPIGKRNQRSCHCQVSFQVLLYMFSAMMYRALQAPMVWILVTLLDGKIFICAFGMSVDPKPFSGSMPDNTGLDLDLVFRNITFRKAVSRYVRRYSQVSVLPFLIDGFNIQIGKMWLHSTTSSRSPSTRRACCGFARKCVVQFFEGMREDAVRRLPLSPEVRYRRKEDMVEEEEERLHGITQQEQMDQLLQTWFQCKPELDVTRMAYRPRVYSSKGTWY
uniref:Uncharacterized protein n=1 Tax=Oncorhynchus mykiss TaxID=8022 RepID=A0A8C7NPL8_ONCMY